MKTLYFLLIVAFCAVVLLLLVWRAEKKHGARLKARKKKLKNKAQLLHQHQPGRLQSVHGQAASRFAHGMGAWEARAKRAGEEIRDGTSFAASRLYTDEEKPEQDADKDLAMGAIEYTPEDAPKTLGPRRHQVRR